MSKYLKQLYNYCTNKSKATASEASRSRQDKNDKTVSNTKAIGEN